MNTIGHHERWSEYELLGLMHREMESMGISGYTVLRSLSEIGVRLDDILDPVIRSHIPVFPEKSKVLFRMVDDLGAETCRELCRRANLYHLTISQMHPIPYAVIESLLRRRGFMLVDFSSMSFLEFRERTRGEGTSTLYRNIIGAIEEFGLFDENRASSMDDGRDGFNVIPFPGEGRDDELYPLDSVIQRHDGDDVLSRYLVGGGQSGTISLDVLRALVREWPNEKILENHLFGEVFATYALGPVMFQTVFEVSDRIDRYLELLHGRGVQESLSKDFVAGLDAGQLSRFLRMRDVYVCPATGTVRHYDVENILLSLTKDSHSPIDEAVIARDAKRMSTVVNPHGHMDTLGITKDRVKDAVRVSPHLLRAEGHVRRLRIPYDEDVLSGLLSDKLDGLRGVFTPRVIYDLLSPEIRTLDIHSPMELRHMLGRKHSSDELHVLSREEIAVRMRTRREFIEGLIGLHPEFISVRDLAEEAATTSGHRRAHWEHHLRSLLLDDVSYVEVEPDVFLRVSRLFGSGLSPSELEGYVSWLLERLPHEEFISSSMAAGLGRGHAIYGLGFDSTFFESVLRRSPLLRTLYIPGGTVYYRNRRRIRHSAEGFLSLHVEDGEPIDDYLHRLEERYGFLPVEEQVLRIFKDTGIYVSDELARLFSDKDSFLRHVYGD
ncbi:hypothetical protein [Exiguobacterium sp. s191]|uniref:hypothetical protein n=1 Tax=Exiguobacterium sp. s191 TaxID=2751196 RepID=UPI001BEC214A|nr:hypothetical protein [Exiguobacterium sp. s191]